MYTLCSSRYPSLNAFMKKFDRLEIPSLAKLGESGHTAVQAWIEWREKNKASYSLRGIAWTVGKVVKF